MALITIQTNVVRPDGLARYEELVQDLAAKARKKSDEWKWTAHVTAFGNTESAEIHYVSASESFAEIQQRGEVAQMIRRVMGERSGEDLLQQISQCLLASRSTISRDRPDLSYPPDDPDRTAPAALVNLLRSRAGHQEAAEEVIRKVAEAIPKVGEPARITTFQTLVGNALQYWTVRPMESLAELDGQLPVADLLEKAFGPAEGGLIYRGGLEAIEDLQRTITLYREELSNPPQA